jgi:hypothetical protein
MVTKTPSGNPPPRRGQVKEAIAKQIAAAVASVLVCDAGGGGAGKKLAGAKILPAPPGSPAKKK